MLLSTLLRELGDPTASPFEDRRISGLAHDSRRVRRGDLFFALRGTRQDGRCFAAEALERGAAALVLEAREAAFPFVSQVIVPDARIALSRAAAGFFGHPERAIPCWGVTGTKGKTTTAYLLKAAFDRGGLEAGLLGTVRYLIGDREIPSPMTTPDASDLFSYLAQMREAGLKAAVMEVSSHALDQGRVYGIPFRGALFTNLAWDHLDYHGDLYAYREAKGRLFRGLSADAVAVVNADDPVADHYAASTRARVVRYGIRRAAEVQGEIAYASLKGMRLRIRHGGETVEIKTPIFGVHNAMNLLAAAAAASAAGVSWEAIRSAFEGFDGVPGRLERIEMGQPFHVLVDYAHTEDALRSVLSSVRACAEGRTAVLFGCGGDRDRGKRPRMGRAAAEIADLVFLTSDNPRGEAPEAILAEIRAGIPEGRPVFSEPDRRAAIFAAVGEMLPGDVLVIAGKGHETCQIFRDRAVPFDDRLIAREAIAAATGRREEMARTA